MAKFGDRLKHLREERGFTVNQLARESGVSASLISRIENNLRGTPKPETIEKLSKALNVKYESLMGLAGYIQFIDKTDELLLFTGKKDESKDKDLIYHHSEVATTDIPDKNINPLTGKKLTSREKKQYTEFMEKAAQALFFDDEISERDKETIYRNITDVFWNAKEKNSVAADKERPEVAERKCP